MPASTGTPGKSGRPPNEAYLALMKPDEDWREIEDSTERRKIQNRLAQRAYRRSLRNRNKELESLKKQLGTFQESSSLSPGHHHSRATSRSRSRSSSGGAASFRHLCPSPDASSPSPPPPALSDYAAVSGPPPPHASMPSSLAAPEWPQDCGNSAALHAVGPYGLSDFMYFDAYPPPPTHEATTTAFDLGGHGFERLETGPGDPSSSSTVSAWISPPASSSEEGPDMQPQQQQPPSTFLQAFGGGAPVVTPPPLGPSGSGSGHAPATPPEAADYMTATTTTTTFPPFPAPDGLGLVYPPHPHPQHHHYHHHHNTVLDPALFDDAVAVADLPPTPPMPSPSLDPQHASLLHMAVASGNVEVLRLILDRVPPALARRPDADGCTPAQRAARAGRPDMLAVLNHSTATHAPTTTTTGTDASGDGGLSLGLSSGPGFESMC